MGIRSVVGDGRVYAESGGKNCKVDYGGIWKLLDLDRKLYSTTVPGMKLMHYSWNNLITMIEKKRGEDILKLAKTVTLREGFSGPSDLCKYGLLHSTQLSSRL